MPNVSRLFAEHDAILRNADVLLTSFEGDDSGATIAAFARLTTAVDAHLAYEDEIVYPHMARQGGMLSQAAQDIFCSFGSLRADWRAYLAAWPPERIATTPGEFTAATHALFPQLAERIRLETEMLYPDALQKGVLPLR